MKNDPEVASSHFEQNLNGPAQANGQAIVPLLLGKGKLARHLHHYFHLIGFEHKHFDDARDLHDPDLHRKIRNVNAIWILTSDQSIEVVTKAFKREMMEQNVDPSPYLFLHSSAATEIPGMETVHPLMTFGENLYSLDQYQRMPFAVISDHAETLRKRFTLSSPRFINPLFTISSQNRALYHAYAVMMSNFPILLWSQTTKEAKEKLSLDPTAFDPILKQTLENFISNRERALTGPMARGDRTTSEKNIAALTGSPLAKIYQNFLSVFLPMFPSKEKNHDYRT